MTVSDPSSRELFNEEIRRSEADFDLARAALLVAREEYPQLPLQKYLSRLDLLAEEVTDRLGGETAPLVVLHALLGTVYERHGFAGNRDAYYDPRNSFLNDVLDRRLGIPLTLGIVLLEVGWRLDLPLSGVDFPLHFLVRFEGDAMDLLVDPFELGRLHFIDEAQVLLDRVYGGKVRMHNSFLSTASKRDMIARLLSNLRGVYMNARDDARALAAVERLLLLNPDAGDLRRTQGTLLARLGRDGEAVNALEAYLRREPGAADADEVRDLLRQLRQA